MTYMSLPAILKKNRNKIMNRRPCEQEIKKGKIRNQWLNISLLIMSSPLLTVIIFLILTPLVSKFRPEHTFTLSVALDNNC